MEFTKMEGLGNDYIYLNCLQERPADPAKLARTLSDRHFGVGGDGLICICPGRGGDFFMEMYNADGSRGAMCGNGIRCLGKYVYDKGLTDRRCLTVDTDSGPKLLELHVKGEKVESVTVNMGRVVLLPWVEENWEDRRLRLYPALVGNPHAVCFCENPEDYPLEEIGPALEHSRRLGRRSNIEFVSVPAEDVLSVRVWERGSGVTLACGTGACAAFEAARRAGLCGERAEVRLPGGVLQVEARQGEVWLTGPARTLFEGHWQGGSI